MSEKYLQNSVENNIIKSNVIIGLFTSFSMGMAIVTVYQIYFLYSPAPSYILATALSLTYVSNLLEFFFGALADNFGRKICIIIGLIGYTVSFYILFNASLFFVIVIYGLLSIFDTIYLRGISPLYYESIKESKKQHRFMSIKIAITYISSLIVYILFIILGLNAYYVVVFFLLISSITSTSLRETLKRKKNKSSYKEIFYIKNIPFLKIVGILQIGVGFALSAYYLLISLEAKKMGISQTTILLLYFLSFAIGILSSFFGAKICDIKPKMSKYFFFGSYLWVGVVFLIFCIGIYLNYNIIFLIGIVLNGLGTFFAPAKSVFIQSKLESSERSKFTGALNTITSLVSIPSSIILPFLWIYNRIIAFFLPALLIVCIVLWSYKKID